MYKKIILLLLFVRSIVLCFSQTIDYQLTKDSSLKSLTDSPKEFKKGQKFNKYTPEQRKEILDKYFARKGSSRSLAKEYNISHKTIETWIRASQQDIPLGYQKKGRPKEENIDYKERYEIIKKLFIS